MITFMISFLFIPIKNRKLQINKNNKINEIDKISQILL